MSPDTPSIAPLLMAVCLAGSTLALAACGPGELDLQLINADSAPLDSVRVATTGFSYELGDLQPGDTIDLRVQSNGEGSLRLAHGGEAGAELVLVPYFQAGELDAVQARLWRDSALVRMRGKRSGDWSPIRHARVEPGGDSDADIVFRTSATAYDWTENGDSTYQVDIPLTYRNESADTLYIVNCNGHLPFALERREPEGWIPFFMMVTNGCLSPPITIEPGATYRTVAQLAVRLANCNLPPGAGRAEMSGEFRLAWHSLRRRYEAHGPTLGDTLEAGLRRSNSFTLR